MARSNRKKSTPKTISAPRITGQRGINAIEQIVLASGFRQKLHLQPGHTYKWAGEYEFEQRAKERLKIILPIVFFAIFVLLSDIRGRERKSETLCSAHRVRELCEPPVMCHFTTLQIAASHVGESRLGLTCRRGDSLQPYDHGLLHPQMQ